MSIRRRIERLEGSNKPKHVPNVIEHDVWSGESKKQAVERHRRKWGSVPKRVFIAPARVTEATEPEFLRQFKRQQTELIAAAKSTRLEEKEHEHVHSHFLQRS